MYFLQMSSFSFFLLFKTIAPECWEGRGEIRSRGGRDFWIFLMATPETGDSATDFVVISPTPSLPRPRAARIPSFDCIHHPPPRSSLLRPPTTPDVDLETQIWMRARAHNVAIVSRIWEFSDFSDANCNHGFWGVYRRTINQCFLQKEEILILLEEMHNKVVLYDCRCIYCIQEYISPVYKNFSISINLII